MMIPPALPSALLNWRVWAALCIAVALAASHWRAYTRGELKVQTKWNAEKLDIAHQTLRLMEKTTRTSNQLQADAEKLRRDKNAQIARLDNDLATALAGLRDRPERPAIVDLPSDPAAGPAPSCTGAQLYKQDGEFLTREAARGQRVLAELAECQAAHQSAREALSK